VAVRVARCDRRHVHGRSVRRSAGDRRGGGHHGASSLTSPRQRAISLFLSNAANPRSLSSERPVRTLIDSNLRAEAKRFELRFTCEDCVHFAAERRACANGYPTRAHLEVIPRRAGQFGILQGIRARVTRRATRIGAPSTGKALMARSHPPTLLTLVARTQREEWPSPARDPLLLALSGGSDSMRCCTHGAARPKAGLCAERARSRSRLRPEACSELDRAALRCDELCVAFSAATVARGCQRGNLQAPRERGCGEPLCALAAAAARGRADRDRAPRR